MLRLVKWGFTLRDVEDVFERHDKRLWGALLARVTTLEAVDKTRRQLDLAEAMNVALVGSQPDKQHRNLGVYRSWRGNKGRFIDKLLLRLTQTIWDRIGRRAKRL